MSAHWYGGRWDQDDPCDQGDPCDPDDPVPDRAYEIPDQRNRPSPPVTVAPETVQIVTRTDGYDGDYGYDMAHDLPGR
ncbi:MAG: hypothetical protein QG622_1183 [Actinomycetota bacterium]|nr:hypothetical protein [Actinomycetota bacterium]